MSKAQEWTDFTEKLNKVDARQLLAVEDRYDLFEKALWKAVDQLDTQLKQAKATLPDEQLKRYFEAQQAIAEKEVMLSGDNEPDLETAFEELRLKFVWGEDFREELKSEELGFGKTNLDRAMEPVFRAARAEGLWTIANMVADVGGMPLIEKPYNSETYQPNHFFAYVDPEKFEPVSDPDSQSAVYSGPKLKWKGDMIRLVELLYILDRKGLINLHEFYEGKKGYDLAKLSRAITSLFEFSEVNEPQAVSLRANGLDRLKLVTLGPGPIELEKLREKKVFGIHHQPHFPEVEEL